MVAFDSFVQFYHYSGGRGFAKLLTPPNQPTPKNFLTQLLKKGGRREGRREGRKIKYLDAIHCDFLGYLHFLSAEF